MTRQPTSGNYTIDVLLKNGEGYYDKDVTPKPMGDSERYVSFWRDEKTIMVIPLTEVANIQLKFQ